MQLLKHRPAAEGGGDSVETPRKKGRIPVRRIVALIVVVGVVAAAAVGARALFFTEEEQVALTETTTYGTLSTAIEGTATTMPNDSVSVTAASAAEILEVYVSAGDTVEAGDLLYVQDDAELDEEIESYQDELTELEEELDGYYDQRAELQESLSALTVTAPFAGRLIEVDGEEGVLVPLSALKSTDEGTCVFVRADTRPDNAVDLEEGVVPDGFYAVPVEVGATNSQYARIVAGVEADTEVFTRYQNAAPSGGDTTSQGMDGEEQEGFPGGGQMPDFGGGQMPDFSGGGMNGGMGGGPRG